MDIRYLLTLFGTLQHLYSIESASVSIPKYTNGVREDSVEIRCSYTHLPGEVFNNMEWLRGPTLTDPNFVPMASTYVSGNGSLVTNVYTREPYFFQSSLISRTSVTFTMTIDRVQCNTEGDFRCMATYRTADNTETRISADTFLAVKDYPDTPMLYLNTPNIREFDEITFTCEARVGKSPGQIIWNVFRQNSVTPMIKNSTTKEQNPEDCNYYKVETLTMRVTREDNMATVLCKIEQELIYDSSTYTAMYEDLNVLFSASTPVIYKSPDTESLELGEDYVLTCMSNGNPEPGIKWYKNGIVVRSAKKLTLRNVTKLDEGRYECVASSRDNGRPEVTRNSSFSLTVIDGSTSGVSVTESQTSEGLSSVTVVLVTSAVWVAVVVIAILVSIFAPRDQMKIKNSFSRLSSKFSVRRREDPSVAFERNYQGLSIKERRGRDSATYASAIFEDSTYLDIVADDGNKSIRGRSSGVYDSSYVPKRALPAKPTQSATPKKTVPVKPIDNNYCYADNGYIDPNARY